MSQIIDILSGTDMQGSIYADILFISRLPQALTAVLAGAGLAVAGLMMQALFRNPLAGPSILGINAGASLGVAFTMMLFGNSLVNTAIPELSFSENLTVILSAFAGAVAILLLVLFLAGKVRNNSMLLILGIMVGYLSSSLVSILQFNSFEDSLHAFVIWGMGSFSSTTWTHLHFFIPATLTGLAISFLLIKPLNALLLGESYARNLGINIRRARISIILCTGLLASSITAFCGPIAFLGLAVPHLTRMTLRQSDHKALVPSTILIGALLALACNLAARLPGHDNILPINAVTAFFGAPVVIYVILKKRVF